MKKAVIVVVVLVLLLLGVGPVGFGYLAERRMNSLLEELSKSGDIDFTVVKVNRGWFSSNTEVVAELSGDIGDAYRQYQIKAKAKDVQPLSLTFRNHIYHGPIPFGAFGDGVGALVPALATIDSEVVGYGAGKSVSEHIPLEIRTRLNLAGGGTTKVVAQPWTGALDGGKVDLDWQGLHGKISFGNDFKKVKSTFEAPRMEGVDRQVRILLSGLKLQSDTRVGVAGLSLGSADFKLAKLQIEPKKAAGNRVSLEGVNIKADSKALSDTIDSVAELRVKHVQVGDMSLGPGVYAVSLRNLDAESLAKINDAMKKLKRQQLPKQQMSMMLGATVLGVLPQLLKKGPVLEITDLSLDTGYGKIRGEGKLTVDNSNPAVLSNPMLLKDALVANVEFEIPEQFVIALEVRKLKEELKALKIKYSDQQIEAMAQARIKKKISGLPIKQFVVLENGMYRFSAGLSAGQLTINGRPFVPPTKPRR